MVDGLAWYLPLSSRERDADRRGTRRVPPPQWVWSRGEVRLPTTLTSPPPTRYLLLEGVDGDEYVESDHTPANCERCEAVV